MRASLGDETPEGRSILTYVRDRHAIAHDRPESATVIPFTANTRVSGIDHDGHQWRKGAVENIVKSLSAPPPAQFTQSVERVARAWQHTARGHLR